MQLVTSLETEKRIYMERVRRAEKKVERFEKEAQSKPSSRTSSITPIIASSDLLEFSFYLPFDIVLTNPRFRRS